MIKRTDTFPPLGKTLIISLFAALTSVVTLVLLRDFVREGRALDALFAVVNGLASATLWRDAYRASREG
jgi:hypothetical protein